MTSDKNREQTVYTICDSHCGGTCVIKAHIKDNKVVRLETDDAEEPQWRACARGRSYRQRIYSPDRLLYPLKRDGKRGSGQFIRISWDEALDTVAKELKRVKDTYGNAAILFFCSMADPHVLHHVNSFNRLLCQFGGYTSPWGSISTEAGIFGTSVTYGTLQDSESMQADFLNSKLIIMWGWNPAVTIQGTNTSWYLAQARDHGSRIISVDPRHTDSTALFAHQWIPIRPGTDTAVMVAMANVIIKENLQDQPFIDKYTVGFDKFREYVLGIEDGVEKTPEWASEISGIPSMTIAILAREYATMKPAALMPGAAAGRSAFGEQYHRAATVLAAITGNIGVHGSGPAGIVGGGPGGMWGDISLIKAIRRTARVTSPPNPVEEGAPPRKFTLSHRRASTSSSARVNVSSFADAILKGKAGGYPADYKFLWLSNNNYLNQLADINKAVKAFSKLEFILVTEQFMTPTAKHADIILPVCTYMERNDFYMAIHNSFYGLVNKVIEPLGESRSQLEICKGLASRLGIDDYNDKTDEEWVKSLVKTLSEEQGLPDYDSLKNKGIYRQKHDEPVVAFRRQIEDPENNPFPTPSGKIEIFSQTMADWNESLLPPIPKYIEAWESVNDPLARKYPLQLVTTHFRRRAHSQFEYIPWLREQQDQMISISTTDAVTRGIKHKDLVRVFNDRGEMIIPANVTERIMPGVVDVPQGAWYNPDEKGIDHGGSANVLTKNVTSPAGAFTSNTCLVQVEKMRN